MEKEELIRHQFNGLTPEVYDWECLTPTAFLKENIKAKGAEKEIILAYLQAAKVLFQALNRANNPAWHMKVFSINQMCMPFLYICRHALELSIKFRYSFETQDSLRGHNLSVLQKRLIEKFPLLNENEDLSLLVGVLSEIDSDGCKLRYSKDNNGNTYQNTPTFIKADKIFELTEKVCHNLMEPIPSIFEGSVT